MLLQNMNCCPHLPQGVIPNTEFLKGSQVEVNSRNAVVIDKVKDQRNEQCIHIVGPACL